MTYEDIARIIVDNALQELTFDLENKQISAVFVYDDFIAHHVDNYVNAVEMSDDIRDKMTQEISKEYDFQAYVYDMIYTWVENKLTEIDPNAKYPLDLEEMIRQLA